MAGKGVRRLLAGIGLVGALAFVWLVFNFFAVRSAATQAEAEAGLVADALVVLGAAQYNGEPSAVLEQRLETALDLFQAGVAEQIVTTGSSQPGDQFTEGFAAFRYLRNNGVAEEAIVVVVDGGDTYESLLATRNQLAEDNRSVVLVTDAYHALRTEEIAEEVGLDAVVVSSSDNVGFQPVLREAVAVSIGRVLSYRRVSAWLEEPARPIVN